jgi:hypothetical protein
MSLIDPCDLMRPLEQIGAACVFQPRGRFFSVIVDGGGGAQVNF